MLLGYWMDFQEAARSSGRSRAASGKWNSFVHVRKFPPPTKLDKEPCLLLHRFAGTDK